MGAVQLTVADVLAAVTLGVPMVGVPGVLAEPYEPVPARFVAATVKVYALPLVSPVNVYEVDDEPVELVVAFPLLSVALTV